ncbi:MAG: winged helix-turn-helix transcriptional regulator [Anaerolineae bacterium]|jgi:ArsR family transcriptional regulator|nr:winged helix-turn-helix transcriptional regulator [Anaerolineae bacterium]
MSETNLNLPRLTEEINTLHHHICYALREPVRILILYLLGEQGRYVNEISELLDIPQPTVSRHLAVLRGRGMVRTERQGTSVFYTLSNPHIIHILDDMRLMFDAEFDESADDSIVV